MPFTSSKEPPPHSPAEGACDRGAFEFRLDHVTLARGRAGRTRALPDVRSPCPSFRRAAAIRRKPMARKSSQPEVSRRKFLAGAAVAGAAASTSVANADTPGTTADDVKRLPKAVVPSVQQIGNETAVPKD